MVENSALPATSDLTIVTGRGLSLSVAVEGEVGGGVEVGERVLVMIVHHQLPVDSQEGRSRTKKGSDGQRGQFQVWKMERGVSSGEDGVVVWMEEGGTEEATARRRRG